MSHVLSLVWNAATWFFSRPALRVRIQRDEPTLDVGGLTFEVENASDKATSLAPTVTVTYLTIRGQRRHVVFDVRDSDRSLPPFLSRQFSASPREVQPERCNGWFRTYVFSRTRGRTCRIRIKNVSLTPIGFCRFHFEQLQFRLTGKVSVRTSMTIDQYRAQERSKGPH